MSVSTRIQAMYDHVEDIYDTMALGGDTTSNKNIVNINTEIKREYKDFLKNGVDTLWNNWEKVSGTGETLSLTPTIKGRIQSDLKGNTQQNGTPTPDTPIPIQVVSGDNSIKVEGEQLFDKDNATILMAYINTTTQKITATDQHDYATTWIKVKPNTTYTISKRAGKSFRVATFTNQPTIDGETYNQTTANHTGTSITITTGANDNYIAFLFWSINNGDTGTYQEMLSTIQVVIGNTAPTTYTPYVSQTYPISLGNIELCKIGTYQDYIYKTDKWYLHKEITKWKVNSLGTWNYDASGKRFSHSWDLTNRSSLAYCNYLERGDTWNKNNRFGVSRYTMYLSNWDYDNTTDLKNWLDSINLFVYYVSQTPTNVEITDSTLLGQLNNLYNANSYEGTTNISQVNDDLPFILNITALKNI